MSEAAGDLPLVSVVIPCYNARRWLGEAIDSCLAQTYPRVEIIIVDDGSTDGSAEAAAPYGARVRLETGPHRGACHARNRGVALARGKYLQFLDADDVILPEKVERQVRFLEDHPEVDFVYGDWRHRKHSADGTTADGPVIASGEHADLLEALLEGWFVAVHAVLHRREAVVRSPGWDEEIWAGQDSDFLCSVLFSGGRGAYQPGCHSLYRRHGDPTISTMSERQWLEYKLTALRRCEARIQERELLTAKYRHALARSYHHFGRALYPLDPKAFRGTMQHVRRLCPEFRPDGTRIYRLTQRLLGDENAERLACLSRRWRARPAPGS